MSLSDEEIARLRERQYEIVRSAQTLRDNCDPQDADQIRQIEQRALARLQATEEQMRALAIKAKRNDRLTRIETKVDLIGERQATQYAFEEKPQRYKASKRPAAVREIIHNLVLMSRYSQGMISKYFFKMVAFYDQGRRLPPHTKKDLNNWRAAAYRAIRDNALGQYLEPKGPRIIEFDDVEKAMLNASA